MVMPSNIFSYKFIHEKFILLKLLNFKTQVNISPVLDTI